MQEVGEVTVETQLADDRVHLPLDPVHLAQADGMDLIRVKVQRRVLADLLAVPGLAAGHGLGGERVARVGHRSEEHTSELQSLMRISYAVFCLKKKTKITKST